MRRTSVLLLLTALLVPALPAGPAAAAPPVCAPGPVELVGVEEHRLTSGQEHVQGYLLRRRLGGGESCVVPGATVQLLARNAGATTPVVVRTATTDAEGRVQFRVKPPFTVVLTGRASAEGFETVQSLRTVLTVATRLTFNRRTVDRCRVAVSGRTTPAKPGTPVLVKRLRSQFDAVDAGRLTVRQDGTYAGTVAVPCGSTEPLFATIQATARNAFGDSRARTVVSTRTTTCGEGRAPSGDVAALTHAFEPYNVTTVVGGSWWGERVVSNRTQATVRFSSASTDVWQLLRSGTRDRIGSNQVSDAVTVTETELAPGQELRELVQLTATNCFATQDGPRFVTQAGPAFPAGTTVVGQTVLATNAGTSTSQRTALTVS